MNPQQQPYPADEQITIFTIHCALNVSQEHADGTWAIHCPEWRYHGHSKNLTRAIALLVSEIETHNEGPEKDAIALMIMNACGAGITAEQFKAIPVAIPKRKRRPIPDDGKCTDRRHSMLPTT